MEETVWHIAIGTVKGCADEVIVVVVGEIQPVKIEITKLGTAEKRSLVVTGTKV